MTIFVLLRQMFYKLAGKNMKPIKKPLVKNGRGRQPVSDSKSHPVGIHITLVSEKERDIYRVPGYGYLLP